jgi:hypothetical protein
MSAELAKARQYFDGSETNWKHLNLLWSLRYKIFSSGI